MHFCNASWTILANYACINWAMLGKKQGVYSYFLILLHPLLYFEVGRHSRVGALEIFSSPFFFLLSLFCYLGMFIPADCIRRSSASRRLSSIAQPVRWFSLRPFPPAFHAGYCVRSFQANYIRRSFMARGVGGLPLRVRPLRADNSYLASLERLLRPRVRHIVYYPE